jgi:hypothetical protein
MILKGDHLGTTIALNGFRRGFSNLFFLVKIRLICILDTSGQADSNPTTDNNNSVNVLLGASNCKRLGTTEFGKLHFTWCIACVRLILTWS